LAKGTRILVIDHIKDQNELGGIIPAQFVFKGTEIEDKNALLSG